MIGYKRLVFGATKIGASHRFYNLPNQDSYLIKYTKNKAIFVVSDGMGSKKYSRIGSRLICSAIYKTAKKFGRISEENYFDFLQESHMLWKKLTRPYPINELSCTVLVLIVARDYIFKAQLGDGEIIIEKDEVIEYEPSLSHEFTNISYGLRNEFDKRLWNVKYIHGVHEKLRFFMCTDGISNDIKVENFLGFYKALLDSYNDITNKERVTHLNHILDSWKKKGSLDDKTIVLKWK